MPRRHFSREVHVFPARRRNSGFSLVELLVAIGIIAVMIGILLPALSRVRDQAQTVQCQSNLRQLHEAFVLYSSVNRNYCMPAEGSNVNTGGSASNYWWLGRYMLGSALNVRGAEKQQQEVLDRIARVLDCPATDRSKIIGATHAFSFDYSYNANLGDIRGENRADPDYAAYHPAHRFKKWTQVPGNVLTCVDSAEPLQQNDERFDTLDELTWKKGYAGSPHSGRKKGNALFHDGSVRLCKLYAVPSGVARIQPSPPANLSALTDLADWMICHPGHADPNSVNKKPSPADVWQSGRPLPF